MVKNESLVGAWSLKLVLALLFVLSLAWLSYGNYQAGSETWQIVISAIFLSIPLGLLYFSIGVLVTAAQQKKSQGQISHRLASLIYWTPRIAGILITLFVGMFALDMFSEGGTFLEMLGGFIIHALPAIIMGIVLALAWKRDWIGFIAFLVVSIFFLRLLLRNPLEQLGTVLLFSGPMAVIAILFWANWKWRDELRSSSDSGS